MQRPDPISETSGEDWQNDVNARRSRNVGGSDPALGVAGTLADEDEADAVPTDADTAIATLMDAVRAFCEARDWDQFHNAKDLAIGVSTEAAELLEHFRFQSEKEVEDLLRDPARRLAIERELADVLIFVLRFGQRYGIDLTSAVLDKLALNEERYPVETAHGSSRKARRAPA